jgi:hypothetical protein
MRRFLNKCPLHLVITDVPLTDAPPPNTMKISQLVFNILEKRFFFWINIECTTYSYLGQTIAKAKSQNIFFWINMENTTDPYLGQIIAKDKNQNYIWENLNKHPKYHIFIFRPNHSQSQKSKQFFWINMENTTNPYISLYRTNHSQRQKSKLCMGKFG